MAGHAWCSPRCRFALSVLWLSSSIVVHEAEARQTGSFAFSTQAQTIPSIGYQVHMALSTSSVQSVCVLGCRQYRQVQAYLPRGMSVVLVCDDCTEPPSYSQLSRIPGFQHRTQVHCSMPSGTTCDAVVIDSHGDHQPLTFLDVIGPLAKHDPKVMVAADWYKRQLAVLAPSDTKLSVSLFSEGTAFQGNQASSVFSNIYHTLAWSADGGGSGLGSTLDYTANLRAALPGLVTKYNIQSILDAPCGSLHWMAGTLEQLPAGLKYTGLDVACHLIHQHRHKFASKHNWSFYCADVCHQQLPKADLVFSRDAMQHLPLAYVMGFLKQVKASGAKYLLIGSYVTTKTGNKNIQIGDYYAIDVTQPPFNVKPAPLEIVDEKTEDGKHMLLFDVAAMQWDTDLTGY